MISVYNKAILKELNPFLLGELEKIENSQEQNIKVLEAKNGEKTIVYQENNKEYYLHSRYNPSYEAKMMLDSCVDLTEECNLVIYGTGLGYHIIEAIKRFPNAKIFLFEPNLELLYCFLSHVELKDLGLKNLDGISNDLAEIDTKIPEMNAKYLGEIKLIWLKSYAEFLKRDFQEFQKSFIRSFKNTWLRTIFFVSHQKRTVTNQMENIKYILESKQLLSGDMISWEGKTALIVAAGPSLDEEIENIRKIKEQGMAYIFAVGSAVNSLLNYGIHADAVFSYDPSVKNQVVLQKIKDENIMDIPLLFGGGIGSETLQDYPGKIFHVKNGSHEILNHYLVQMKETPYVRTGTTISVMALDAVFNMGFSDIILVGQNLGIVEEKAYSSGIFYVNPNVIESEQYSEKEINVHGKDMKTSPTYLTMRQGIETIIKVNKEKSKVWNSTRNGLCIQGAEYKPLIELMDKMQSNSVDCKWQENREEILYDTKYIQEKREEMEAYKKDSEKQFERMESILEDIKKQKEIKLYCKLPKLYTKLNINLTRLEENKYSSIFVLSAIIHEYHDLILGINRFNLIEDKEVQAETIYQAFKKFTEKYKNVKEEICDKYYHMDKELEQYCKGRDHL